MFPVFSVVLAIVISLFTIPFLLLKQKNPNQWWDFLVKVSFDPYSVAGSLWGIFIYPLFHDYFYRYFSVIVFLLTTGTFLEYVLNWKWVSIMFFAAQFLGMFVWLFYYYILSPVMFPTAFIGSNQIIMVFSGAILALLITKWKPISKFLKISGYLMVISSIIVSIIFSIAPTLFVFHIGFYIISMLTGFSIVGLFYKDKTQKPTKIQKKIRQISLVIFSLICISSLFTMMVYYTKRKVFYETRQEEIEFAINTIVQNVKQKKYKIQVVETDDTN